MSLLVTPAEAIKAEAGHSVAIARAHKKSHYIPGTKVPLVTDRTSKSPMAIQVQGVAEYSLGSINDNIAKWCGFPNRAAFLQHWRESLYGKNGIDPSGGGRQRDDTKVILYRFVKTDYVATRYVIDGES